MRQNWELSRHVPLATILLVSSTLARADEQTLTVEGTPSLGDTTKQTASYTTGEARAAPGLTLSPQETPQSVSVLTRQRMDDQQLTSVQSALEATTGITLRTLDSERGDFYSRGFSIDSFQFDGVPTSFQDRYQQKKPALYAVIDADLSDDTTLSVGYDAQIIQPKGTTWGGVPRWYR